VLVVLERVCPAVVSAAAVVKGDLCGVAVLVVGIAVAEFYCIGF